MQKYFITLFIVLSISLPLAMTACAKPPKPGPNFVWVQQGGAPGHWKHIGSPNTGKGWVKGHYNKDKKWIAGHWKKGAPPKAHSKWIPAHRTPTGKKIPGHWAK